MSFSFCLVHLLIILLYIMIFFRELPIQLVTAVENAEWQWMRSTELESAKWQWMRSTELESTKWQWMRSTKLEWKRKITVNEEYKTQQCDTDSMNIFYSKLASMMSLWRWSTVSTIYFQCFLYHLSNTSFISILS